MDKVIYSSPAKTILFGEHFVVYGAKAIATAIDMRSFARASRLDEGQITITSRDFNLRAEWIGEEVLYEYPSNSSRKLYPIYAMVREILTERKAGVDVEIWSQIPRGSGLGSSASVSVAVAAATLGALGEEFDMDDVERYASISEGIIHSRPSGIDVVVTSRGGVISYRRGGEVRRLSDVKLSNIILVNSSMPHKTGKMVEKVARFKEHNPDLFARLLERYEELADEVEVAIRMRDLRKLGLLMLENHELLRSIGVSNEELDGIVREIMELGGLGAKLTGGGGGGCVIALVDEDSREIIYRTLSKRYKVYAVRTSETGLRRE